MIAQTCPKCGGQKYLYTPANVQLIGPYNLYTGTSCYQACDQCRGYGVIFIPEFEVEIYNEELGMACDIFGGPINNPWQGSWTDLKIGSGPCP
jgi:ssDNA-binding Zn-finger/Zn-ribbon topoisomerase 1